MIVQRHLGWALLGVSVCVIALATLTPGGGGSTTALCILCGSRGLADFLSNVLLFAPFGAALGLLTGSMFRSIAAGVLISIGVEVAQVAIVPGRDANAGDLVANGLGALAGWLVVRSRHHWLAQKGARARSLILTAAALAGILFGLSLFEPAFQDRTYYLQWTARFGKMQAYDGRVLSTRIGALDLPGPWRIDASDRVRRMLTAGEPVVIEAIAGAPPAGTAPIVSIYDDLEREVMLIGADGGDLVYRYRTRADVLRLDRGELRIPGALDHVEPGSPLRITMRKERNGFCVEVNKFARCEVGFTAADTWMLLVAPGPRGLTRSAAGGLWLFLVFLPCGLLAAADRFTAFLVALIAGVLLAGPAWFGFASTPWPQVAAACIALFTGACLRTLLDRFEWLTGPVHGNETAALSEQTSATSTRLPVS